MSNNLYMRQIMESISRAQSINEGYEDRVSAMVSQLSRNNPDGLLRKAFDSEFKTALSMVNPVEARGSEQALRDFKKDVMAKVTFRRDTSSADSKRERTNQVLDQLSMIISDAVGNSFPDGDPFDSIYPKARRLGVPADSMIEWLDRAARKGGLGKSYHDYLANLWDDQYADAKSDYEHNPDQAGDRYNMMGGDKYRNPWR